jgi:hypothetical protein
LLDLCDQPDMNEDHNAGIFVSFYPWGSSLNFFIVFSPAFTDACPEGFLARSKQFVSICTLNSRQMAC